MKKIKLMLAGLIASIAICFYLRPSMDFSANDITKSSGGNLIYAFGSDDEISIKVDDPQCVYLPWESLLSSKLKILALKDQHGILIWDGTVGRIVGRYAPPHHR